jgi:serine/threonine protein kinase
MEAPDQHPSFQAPSTGELQPLLPAFEIEGLIAQGGMGAVYAARQTSLDRPAAIKILPREFGDDGQFRANFEAEAKSMARLNHPNLIGVYDFGEVDGYLFIVMEMVAGKSLYHSAHGRVVEQVEAAELVATICRGLAHAHQAGILHRDIKPANILLAAGPVPKIGDFGLAQPMGERPEDGGPVYGTPGYSAPEVVQNPAAVDQRADIFSVGVVLYELLTGQLPQGEWQDPSALVGCDPAFDKITRRATHPSPGMRYGDAEELADELEKLAAKLSGPAAKFAVGGQAARVGGGSPALVAPKSRGGLMVLVAVLVLGAVGAAAIFLRDRDQPPVAPPVAGGGDEAPPGPDDKPVESDDPEPDGSLVSDPGPDPDPEPRPVPEPEPEPAPPESQSAALARLQPALKAGDLSELPPGTVSRGGARFLLVDSALTWLQASSFAEHHGAQLAVFESPVDLKWAAGEFELSAPVWLGLSDSGTEGSWHWADGRPVDPSLWAPGQPDDTPTADDGEDFAVLLPNAVLDDEPAGNERKFVLQWFEDGSRQGSLASQMQRTGEMLGARQAPVFPAGSRNINGSRFLLVPTAHSWEQAAAMAKAAGGHLAVPSSEEEAAWLLAAFSKMLQPGESCWVGGRRTTGQPSRWAFVTAEKFEFIKWMPGQPDEDDETRSYLQFARPMGPDEGMGYLDTAGEDQAVRYMMVEWSAPSRRNMPGAEDKPGATNAVDWLLAKRKQTAEEHKGDYERFRKRWDENVEEFAESVADRGRSWGRGRFGGGRGFLDEFAEGIKEADRVPEEIPGYAGRAIGDLHDKALREQERLWDGYEKKFQQALDEYLGELRSMAGRLQQAGRRDDAAYLGREVAATSAEHQRFHDILGGEFPAVPEEE